MILLATENLSFFENEPENDSENEKYASNQHHQDSIKRELRQRIYKTLETAIELAPGDRSNEIRVRLSEIQNYCQTLGKTFIFVEESITCNQFDLGGSIEQTATLFRGPNETASVAICVTYRGSVLHRNGYDWTVYINEGDIQSVMVCNAPEFITLLP